MRTEFIILGVDHPRQCRVRVAAGGWLGDSCSHPEEDGGWGQTWKDPEEGPAGLADG